MIPNIKTYNKDKRLSLEKLYDSFSNLDRKIWIQEILYIQKDKDYFLPILAFRTRKKGRALFIISGIHGEEPAGPNAIAKNISFLNKLTKKIPIVLLPLCNPRGYRKNWRYPNRKNAPKNKTSKIQEYSNVGDSEHLLLDLKNQKKTRGKTSLKEAKAITSYIVKISRVYKPLLSMDFHEDDSATGMYIFSQGKLGEKDPIAKKVVNILKKRKFKFYKKAKTSFGQNIINGIVSNINDGSIDELLASEKIIINNKIKKGPNSKSVIVIETNSKGISLKKRVDAHSEIIKQSGKFFRIATNQ